jgi:thymidylate kinase
MTDMLGKCFALEGLECSGKTTLFKHLQKKYTNTNIAFIPEAAAHFFDKYETNLNGNSAVEVGFMTFNAIAFDKAYTCINEGYNVIFDRSWLCQLVYSQARALLNVGYNFNTKYIEYQEEFFKDYYPEVFENTVLVYLDLPIATIIKRKFENTSRHPNQQKFDNEWLRNVYTVYKVRLINAQKNGIEVEIINSDMPIEEVVRDFDRIFRKYALNIKKIKSKNICVFGKKGTL